MFALFIVYIWVSVVKSRYSFSESFMAAFKAFFQSGFFSGVIFLGCAAIIAAIDLLITNVDSKAYAHTANIVFIVIAPLFFLSLIPVYPGRYAADSAERSDGTEAAPHARIEKRTGCPKFLEILLSYIIVPLASVFTVILLIYIALNISGKFWTNNLLEPLLISYSITIIVLTVLISRLENKLASVYRMIIPKVLIPIALFQVIASILLMADTGVTYSRYFVILYGVFAVLSGCVLSLLPVRRSGLIAVFLIILSAISLVPPVDAFTVSRNSQIYALEYVLKKDGMLSDQGLAALPNNKISDADKLKIISSIQYLASIDALGRVNWLPAGFTGYDDAAFYSTFGFSQYMLTDPQYQYVNVYFDMSGLTLISGYDAFAEVSMPAPDKTTGQNVQPVHINGKPDTSYAVSVEGDPGAYFVTVRDGSGQILNQFNTALIFKRYASFPASKSALTEAEATFTSINSAVRMKIIVMNAGFDTAPGSTNKNAQMLVFLQVNP